MIDDFISRENIVARENYLFIIFIRNNGTESLVTVTIKLHKGKFSAAGKFNDFISIYNVVYISRRRHKEEGSHFVRRVAAP